MITVNVSHERKKKKRKRYFVARQSKRYRRETQIFPFDSKSRNLNVTESCEDYIVGGPEARSKKKLILESYNSIRKQEFIIITEVYRRIRLRDKHLGRSSPSFSFWLISCTFRLRYPTVLSYNIYRYILYINSLNI